MQTATQAAAGARAGATAPTRIAVIGVGRIGSMHAELLARRVPGAAVSALFDAHADSARGVGAALGVPVAGSIEEVLASRDVDAVAICTTTDTHADLIVEAARAGKAIFCEKPVSLDLVTVDRALAAVEQAGVPFQIGFNRRFDPAHASVARAVVDSVADGVIPKDKADDYVIVCGVFIHWDAADDTKIYQYNYDATKLAIKNAMAGTPKINDIITRKGEKHPFSPK